MIARAVLICLCMGDSLEIGAAISEAKDAYCNVEKWSKPQKPGFSLTWTLMRPVVRKEAKGVVLIIAPFNYPLWLTFVPLVRAFSLRCFSSGSGIVLIWTHFADWGSCGWECRPAQTIGVVSRGLDPHGRAGSPVS